MRIRLTAICCLVGLFAGELMGAIDAREVFKQSAPSVVLIKTYKEDGTPIAIGSGFFIKSPAALVTNAHVIEGAARIEFVAGDKPARTVETVMAVDEVADLAILEAKGEGLVLATRAPEVGEPVFVLGNPKGLTQTISDGIVSALRSFEDTSVVQITAPISPGSSGGPVLGADGAVLGVATFTRRDGQNLNFAVAADHVAKLLARPKPQSVSAAGSFAGKSNLGGEGRIKIVRTTLAAGALSMSLQNNEDYRIRNIVVRVLYFERGGADAALREKRRKELALDKRKPIDVDALAARIALLKTPPKSWRFEDLPKFEERSKIKYSASEYLQHKDTGIGSVTLKILQSEIPDALAQAQVKLANAKTENEQIAAVEAERVRLKEEEAKSSTAPKVLVDYRDFTLKIDIAPKLTRAASLTVEGEGNTLEYQILDYEVVR